MTHSHEGAGLDIVEPPVLHQELDGGAGLGALLHLVQQDQRPARLHGPAGVGAEVGDDGIRVQTAGKNGAGIFFRHKIELHKVLVVLPPELPDQRGLADLACAGDAQGLFCLLIFPFSQVFIGFPTKHSRPPLSASIKYME